MESWKIIKDYPMYKISNYGRVYSLYSRKYIKPVVDKSNGYMKITLVKNKVKRNHYIHRLVATHFINNVNNNKEINHIDGDKTNNKINNLEWIDRQGNMNHYFNSEKGKHRCMKIKCLETGIIYNSQMEAYRETGINQSSISINIKGKIDSVNGFHFIKI